MSNVGSRGALLAGDGICGIRRSGGNAIRHSARMSDIRSLLVKPSVTFEET